MQILLEEFYKSEINLEKFHFRKLFLDEQSCQINGISKSGKTKLIKSYLLEHKRSSYLYIDCDDIRIDVERLNASLSSFCNKNKIAILVLDNYITSIAFPNVSQLIITSEAPLDIAYLPSRQLYPLDYEEFLAYEHKYDSSALNHFFQLGGFAHMHKITPDERSRNIQQFLSLRLAPMELDILVLCAKLLSNKLSAFMLYERLKLQRKISKDKLYHSFALLLEKKYIHALEKFGQKKATKKIYLCDPSLKSALSIEKNFGKLFENMVYLELLKSAKEIYYSDGIDFYLPKRAEIVLCKPFADERRLFKKLESIEAFLFTHSIEKITVVSMNIESHLSHPLAKVEILPFDIWALGD